MEIMKKVALLRLRRQTECGESGEGCARRVPNWNCGFRIALVPEKVKVTADERR